MIENRKEGRFIGIDLSKRTMEVCFVSDGEKIRCYKFGTDSEGLKGPASLISKEDAVGPGVCGFSDHTPQAPGREAGAGCMR